MLVVLLLHPAGGAPAVAERLVRRRPDARSRSDRDRRRHERHRDRTDRRRAPAPDRRSQRPARAASTAVQTSFDFYGRRRIGFILSVVLLVLITVCRWSRVGSTSASTSRAGSSWDVPPSSFTIDDAEPILSDNGIDPSEAPDPGAQLRQRRPASRSRSADQPAEVREQLRHGVRRIGGRRPSTRSASTRSAPRGAARSPTRRSARSSSSCSSWRCSSRSASSGGWRSRRSSPCCTTS